MKAIAAVAIPGPNAQRTVYCADASSESAADDRTERTCCAVPFVRSLASSLEKSLRVSN